MLRFLHCADLHIDAPSAVSRPRRLAAFGAIIDQIIEGDIPVCLIAGDLFDTPTPSAGAVQAVAAGFARASGCRFFITPGNHDPYTPDSVWATTDFGGNVTVFDTEEVERVELAEYGAYIYGFAFTGRAVRRAVLAGVHADTDGINLLVAHADMQDANSTCCPTNERELCACGMDYIALGHIHKGGQVYRTGDTVYAYAGCACGGDFGECGRKGALIGRIERSADRTDTRVEFRPLASYHYERASVNISGCADDAQTAARLTDVCREADYGADCAVHFTLTGEVSADYRPAPTAIAAMVIGPDVCEVIDTTLPLADRGALEVDPTLRGEFYRALADLLDSSDPAERGRAELALKLGMAAMDGGELEHVEI